MTVEIWSDIVCPWCCIGKAHFDQALASFEYRDEVRVVWRSFELDPGAPAVRDDTVAAQIAARYGGTEAEARPLLDQMTARAAALGLHFDFDRARSGNTFDAHRLLHLARSVRLESTLTERLFRAYFSDGDAIGDRETLVRIAAESGLDAREVRAVLESTRYADDVRADEAEARALGVTGVPFFVFDRRLAASGAQPPELLLSALQQARAAATD